MNFENNNNLYNYNNLQKMSTINEILLNLIPSDLIKNVLQYSAPVSVKQLTKQIRKQKYKNHGIYTILNLESENPLDKNGNYYWSY